MSRDVRNSASRTALPLTNWAVTAAAPIIAATTDRDLALTMSMLSAPPSSPLNAPSGAKPRKVWLNSLYTRECCRYTSGRRIYFLRALDVPAAERGAFVAEACGTDARLRQEVESLLSFHEEGASTRAADRHRTRTRPDLRRARCSPAAIA